ncbi:uncharacterized protein LOC117314680 [Pecten maximus]|uniref:uncharacterized protein LOC117314680 n=1 Tax=Pecten maximus TaxID=6579 RepID=UPI001458F618|nr:uncharacterized protein LOC117314680 [Pecten maximus]
MGKPCDLCRKDIIDNKSYRKTGPFLDTLKSIGVTIGVYGVLCNICVYKLNKINKYEFDIASKLSRMKTEREKLCTELRSLAGTFSTPLNSNPFTPCMPERTLAGLESVVKCEPQERPPPAGLILFTNFISTSLDKSTQTKKDEEDFEVKVIVKYNGIERSRVVKNSVWKSVCKQIVNNGKPNMKTIAKDVRCKREMINVVKSKIKTEVMNLVKKNNSVFRGENKDILNFNWSQRVADLQHVAPCLFDILTSVSVKTQHMYTAASILMYSRCQRLNLLQYILALVLDRCGLTKEGLQLMHHLGLSMSHGSILRKKTDLVDYQKEIIIKSVTSFDREKSLPPSYQQNIIIEDEETDLAVQQDAMIEDEETDSVVYQGTLIKDEEADLAVQQDAMIEDEETDSVVHQDTLIEDEETDSVVQQEEPVSSDSNDSYMRPIGATVYIEKCE